MAAAVLIVEDDADLRESLQILLKRRGHRVVTAEHGRAALEKLQDGDRPGLILLDLMMPVMDGWQLRAALQRDSRFASIPVVVISGVADLSSQANALEAEAYVGKPVDLRRVYELVSTYC